MTDDDILTEEEIPNEDDDIPSEREFEPEDEIPNEDDDIPTEQSPIWIVNHKHPIA